MSQLTLNNAEHAFYKAGEAIGQAGAMGQVVQDLRAAAAHYKDQVDIAEKMEAIAAQLEGQVVKHQQSYAQLVEQAIRLRCERVTLSERIRRAAQGACKGWRGAC